MPLVDKGSYRKHTKAGIGFKPLESIKKPILTPLLKLIKEIT